MTFYFITHVLLGLIAGNYSRAVMGHRSITSMPIWALTSSWLSIGSAISIFCALVSIPITFFKWDFFWGLLTIGEVLIGATFAALVPASISNLMLLIGPVVSLILCGALLGFWFVPLSALIFLLFILVFLSFWHRPAQLRSRLATFKNQGNGANNSSSNTVSLKKSSEPIASAKKQNNQKIKLTAQGKARSSSKLKARAVLLKFFKYSLEEKAIPFFESTVITVERENGNEHDVAVQFILARLDELVPQKGAGAELFIKQNSQYIYAVLRECKLDTEIYIERLNEILKRHKIQKTSQKR